MITDSADATGTQPTAGAAEPPRAEPPWLPVLAAVAAWGAALIVVAVLAVYARNMVPHMGDMRVYRIAAIKVFNGRPIYPPVPSWEVPELGRTVLIFTYPPVAAVLAAPLAFLDVHESELAWIPVVYLPLAVAVWLSFRPLLARDRRWAPATLGALFAGCACLSPVVQQIRFGQVDMALAALCLADLAVRRPRWPRGLLIGVATAVKLTPGVFIVYLLVTGRRKAAAVSAVSAAACTGLAWLVIPADSRSFWTRAVLQPDRLGPNAQLSDQSVRAMLLRAFAPGSVPGLLWLALAGMVGCAGFAAARVAWRRGDEIGGAAITGLTAVLISPVSWIHHLVWVVVALGAITGDGRSRLRGRMAVGVAAFFLVAVPYLAWNRVFESYAPVVLQALLQDSDGIAAALLIAVIVMLPAPPADLAQVPPPRLQAAAPGAPADLAGAASSSRSNDGVDDARAAGPGWPARPAQGIPAPPARP